MKKYDEISVLLTNCKEHIINVDPGTAILKLSNSPLVIAKNIYEIIIDNDYNGDDYKIDYNKITRILYDVHPYIKEKILAEIEYADVRLDNVHLDFTKELLNKYIATACAFYMAYLDKSYDFKNLLELLYDKLYFEDANQECVELHNLVKTSLSNINSDTNFFGEIIMGYKYANFIIYNILSVNILSDNILINNDIETRRLIFNFIDFFLCVENIFESETLYLYYNFKEEVKNKSFYIKGSSILKNTNDICKFLDNNKIINIKEIFDFYKNEKDFCSISSNYKGRDLYDSKDLKSIIRFETIEIINRDIKLNRCLGCKKLIIKNAYCDSCRKNGPVTDFRKRNKKGLSEDPMLKALTNSYQAKRYYIKHVDKDMESYCKEIIVFYNVFKNMLNYLQNETQKMKNKTNNKINQYSEIRKEILEITELKNYDAIFFECIKLLKKYQKEINEYKVSIAKQGELKQMNRALYVVSLGRNILKEKL